MENATIATAKSLTFGTELEYTNISRERAAKAIYSVIGGRVRYERGAYDTWTVTAPDGRVWKAVSDGSLGNRAKSASTKDKREFRPESAAYDMRVFLLRLGFIGEEFKSTRLHLLKRLPGDSAWKNGARTA